MAAAIAKKLCYRKQTVRMPLCIKCENGLLCVDFLKAMLGTAAAATGDSRYAHNLRLRGRPPPTICARLDRPVNALQLCR